MITFKGTYFDGKHSQAHSVTVICSDHGLSLRDDANDLRVDLKLDGYLLSPTAGQDTTRARVTRRGTMRNLCTRRSTAVGNATRPQILSGHATGSPAGEPLALGARLRSLYAAMLMGGNGLRYSLVGKARGLRHTSAANRDHLQSVARFSRLKILQPVTPRFGPHRLLTATVSNADSRKRLKRKRAFSVPQ